MMCSSHSDYHDLYLTTAVLLRGSVSEAFLEVSYKRTDWIAPVTSRQVAFHLKLVVNLEFEEAKESILPGKKLKIVWNEKYFLEKQL